MSPNGYNSLIFEGTVIHPPEPSVIGGMFALSHVEEGEVIEMRIEVKPGPLLQSCSQHIMTGKRVRVVGNLIQTYKDDWIPNETRVLAAYVEFQS